MISIDVEIDGIDELDRKFIRDPERIKEETVKVLKQEARTLAYELGYATNPFGTYDPVKYRGRITADVRRVYASRDKILSGDAGKVYALLQERDPELANLFWAQLKSGDYDRAMKTVRKGKIGTKADFDSYKTLRGAKNRISPSQKAVGIVAESRIVSFLNKQLKKVGMAKGGWFQAQKDIGGRSRGSKQFPKWVRDAGRKSAGSLGGSEIRVNGDKPSIVLVNRVKYVKYALTETLMQKAIDQSEKRFKKELEARWRGINNRRR